jgi:hypothetical protein
MSVHTTGRETTRDHSWWFAAIFWATLLGLGAIAGIYFSYEKMLDEQAVQEAKDVLALHGNFRPESDNEIRRKMADLRDKQGYSRAEVRHIIVTISSLDM